MENARKDISRRDFMRGVAVAGATGIIGASLTGCANASTEKTPTSSIKWTKEADVVVLGSGGAGLCTAFAAAKAGANVLIIEKATEEDNGGNTKVSGQCWTTTNDEKKGLAYALRSASRIADTQTVDYVTALNKALVELNDGFGADLGLVPVIGKKFSPEFDNLDGSDAIKCYVHKGGSGDSQLWLAQKEAADGLSNIEFMYETPGVRLITDSTGMVIGIVAKSGGEEINIKAKKGLVLACGGYEFNQAMIENTYPGWPVYGRGTPYNTGDGIKMAQKVGAALWHMNPAGAAHGVMRCPGLKFGNDHYNSDDVTADLVDSIKVAGKEKNTWIDVDKYGNRFMSESRETRHGFGHREYTFWYDGDKCEWPRLPAWVIFDETMAKAGPIARGANAKVMAKFSWFATHSGHEWSQDNSKEVDLGWIYKGSTPEELAGKINVDPAALAATISRYNSFAANGSDDDFGRAPESLAPLSGPFYAVAAWPGEYNTQGGPVRNEKAQTLDVFGDPIPGLYNVGECGAGFAWVYNGGWNNAESMVTGQWAGTDAAARPSWDA